LSNLNWDFDEKPTANAVGFLRFLTLFNQKPFAIISQTQKYEQAKRISQEGGQDIRAGSNH